MAIYNDSRRVRKDIKVRNVLSNPRKKRRMIERYNKKHPKKIEEQKQVSTTKEELRIAIIVIIICWSIIKLA